jgi:hypothetical protein
MSRIQTYYESRVAGARAAIENDHVLSEILSPGVSPLVLECFLIEWLSRTPYMLDPSTDWIRRAGEQCLARDMKRVGAALVEFARRETIEPRSDTKNLRAVVRALNAQNGVHFDSEALLRQPPTVTMRAYRLLHEEVLGTDLAAGEVAISYEIERASSVFGLALLLAVQRGLGPEAALRLSGLRKRAPHGVERTAFFGRALAEVVDRLPEATDQLAEIGAGVLDIYRHFLRDCAEAAHARANAIESRSRRTSSNPEVQA